MSVSSTTIDRASTEGEPAWEIATLFPPQGMWEVSDYLELTDHTNRLVEFADGQVIVLDVPTDAHQDLLAFIFVAIHQFLTSRGLPGKVRTSGLRLQTGGREFREPDLVVKLSGRVLPEEQRYWVSAEVVVEIVSEGEQARARDYVTKRDAYARAGVAEYWIVDLEHLNVTVLSLGTDGQYLEHGVFTEGQMATSVAMQGFILDVAAAFASARD